MGDSEGGREVEGGVRVGGRWRVGEVRVAEVEGGREVEDGREVEGSKYQKEVNMWMELYCMYIEILIYLSCPASYK